MLFGKVVEPSTRYPKSKGSILGSGTEREKIFNVNYLPRCRGAVEQHTWHSFS
jgi:hypothetical protein